MLLDGCNSVVCSAAGDKKEKQALSPLLVGDRNTALGFMQLDLELCCNCKFINNQHL